ncbi:MAG: hypothetical protein U0W24_13910 [Bacteroidales bacterium]
MKTKIWTIAFWILFVGWVTGALLFMFRIKGGFLTNYLSDLTFPPWFYIYIRGLSTSGDSTTKVSKVRKWFGSRPEIAMVSILLVGVISEFKTLYWPDGIISGTFDYLDIGAYTFSLIICYFFDKRNN